MSSDTQQPNPHALGCQRHSLSPPAPAPFAPPGPTGSERSASSPPSPGNRLDFEPEN
jgi:hypothetical protein